MGKKDEKGKITKNKRDKTERERAGTRTMNQGTKERWRDGISKGAYGPEG